MSRHSVGQLFKMFPPESSFFLTKVLQVCLWFYKLTLFLVLLWMHTTLLLQKAHHTTMSFIGTFFPAVLTSSSISCSINIVIYRQFPYLLTMSSLQLSLLQRTCFRTISATSPSVHEWTTGASLTMLKINWYLLLPTTDVNSEGIYFFHPTYRILQSNHFVHHH